MVFEDVEKNTCIHNLKKIPLGNYTSTQYYEQNTFAILKLKPKAKHYFKIQISIYLFMNSKSSHHQEHMSYKERKA